MPVAMVSYAVSKAEYDAVPPVIDPRPDGLLAHAASELPDGRVQIVDVWRDQATAQQFAETVLFPAFRQAGLLEQMMSRPQPVAYETFDLALAGTPTWERLTVRSWMLGCALLAVGDVIRVAAGDDSGNSVVALGWGVQALGAMLAIVGLPGVYRRHVERTGRLGIAGLGGIAVFLFLFGVFGGVLHAVAVPALVSEGITKPPGVSQAFLVGVIFALFGCVALGMASIRLRVRPLAAVPLLGGGIGLLAGHPIGMHVEDVGLLLLLTGLGWAASARRRDRDPNLDTSSLALRRSGAAGGH